MRILKESIRDLVHVTSLFLITIVLVKYQKEWIEATLVSRKWLETLIEITT